MYTVMLSEFADTVHWHLLPEMSMFKTWQLIETSKFTTGRSNLLVDVPDNVF